MRKVVYATQMVAILFILINLTIQGLSVTNFFSSAAFESSNNYMSLRYSGGLIKNFYAQSSVVLNYLGVSLAGLIFNSPVINKKTLLMIAFFPSLSFLVFYADKGTVLLSIAFFYGAVLVSRVKNGNDFLFSIQALRSVFLSILFISPFMIYSFFSRGLYELDFSDALIAFSNYFFSYAFAHLYTFSDWFSYSILSSDAIYSYEKQDLANGFYTFMGLFQALGDDRVVVHGVFDEYFSYGGISSNIYTIYRGMIIDFGVFGSLLFMFILGLLFNLNYFIMRRNQSIISVTIYIYMVGFIYTSFIISLFLWNSVLVSMLLLIFFLHLSKIKV